MQSTQNDQRVHIELSDILDKDIEKIVALRLRAERQVDRHQRFIENVTRRLGQPRTVYILLALVAIWIVVNTFGSRFGIASFDRPPFSLLQTIISLSALIMTVIVLTTQNRQEKMHDERRHLDLQITLLTERKVSKIIELLEELRSDLPAVTDRHDAEARVMQKPVDPHTALEALKETFEKAGQHEKGIE